MSSKRQEERNEKIIRGLMKLPPNRHCINCNILGPQYVCTNFWTFICTTCSGIHREFTHRVKSVSMAKFTSQEVEALQKGGNQRAREVYLKDWDPQRHGFPFSGNVERVRDFIKSVYVDKRFAGTGAADKPPRDANKQNHEDDVRRASSYHSFSQSPPYEHQYEERRYGKQPGMLTRKPGSDRVHYEGKISSFIYSPGRLSDHAAYEDRFSNESPGRTIAESRDQCQVGAQSPNFQSSEFSSPTRPAGDIVSNDGRLPAVSKTSEIHLRQQGDSRIHQQGTVPLCTLLSADDNPTSSKSVTSYGLIDSSFDPATFGRLRQPPPSFEATSHGPFNILPTNSSALNDIFADIGQEQKASSIAPPVDLFANVNHHQRCSTSTPSDLFASATLQQSLPAPFSETEGWATFDSPLQASQPSGVKNFLGSSATVPPHQHFDIVSSDNAQMQDPPAQGSISATGPHWNAFDSPSSNLPYSYVGAQLLTEVPDVVTATFQSSSVDGHIVTATSDGSFSSSTPFPSSATPSMGDVHPSIQFRKTINPFDAPDEPDTGIGNKFLDVSSLQAVLPNSQFPTFVDDFNTSWFSSSSGLPYLPPLPQGSQSHTGGQTPATQLQKMPPPSGQAPSLGGNPFA